MVNSGGTDSPRERGETNPAWFQLRKNATTMILTLLSHFAASRRARNVGKQKTRRACCTDHSLSSSVPPNHRGGLADLGHLVQHREYHVLELLVSLGCVVVVRPEVDNEDVARLGVVEVFNHSAKPEKGMKQPRGGGQGVAP